MGTRQSMDAVYLSFFGGLGEIGMNCTAISHGNTAILLDCGIAFPRTSLPIAEFLLPDMDAILENPNMDTLVITHGHEDHIGGAIWLLKKRKMRVLAPPFALEVLKEKVAANELSGVNLVPIYPRQQVTIGDLSLEFIRVTHSIPDALAVMIRTPQGNILHTGDFRVDTDPLRGEPFQMEAFGRMGKEGVALLMSDSTNVLVPGRSRSEKRDLGPQLDDIIAAHPGRVFVTMFASNVHRMERIWRAGRAAGRELCLIGRSMETYLRAAIRCRESEIPMEAIISPSAAETMPDNRVLVLVTGSQGEARSALTRLAFGSHPEMSIREGDLVVYSSRMIPGNELEISTVCNALARSGAQVLTSDSRLVHVTGHAYREELKEIIQKVNPGYLVPVHGEYRFLAAHAQLAEECGVESLLVENGAVLKLKEGRISHKGNLTLQTIYVSGEVTGTEEQLGIRARKKLFFNGAIFARLLLGRKGGLDDCFVEALGLPDPQGDLKDRLEKSIRMAMKSRDSERDLVGPDEIARRAIRQEIRRMGDLKPQITLLVDPAASKSH